MRNLLIITQRVDENDDLLGFFISWIREFARHFEAVHVITLGKGKYDLPDNVMIHSLGKERGTPKIFQAVNYYKLLFQLVPKTNAIFAHMSPIFAVSSWPVAALYRKKIVLWYLHRSVTLRLKIAEKLVYKIVTAVRVSLNLKSYKIVEVGHGIDVERFRTERTWEKSVGKPWQILSVGRISPIKSYETLIEAAKILKNKGMNFIITIVGQPIMRGDFEYFESLKRKTRSYELETIVIFAGFIPYSKIADYYKDTDMVINLTPTGGIDKTVLESMASGALILASNQVLENLLKPYADTLLFKYADANDLAHRILSVSILPVQVKKDMSNVFIRRVESGYSTVHVVERIQKLL